MNIQIDNLSKRYGRQLAVDHISFEVRTGEIVGFLGPNGAGKSTTMKMITSYIAPDSGNVLIGGKSMHEHADELKRHIGYLPENNPLYTEMPVMDYLAFVGELNGVEKSQLQERIREMVRICGLDKEKHKKIQELSKGYRQRVGLAQAMIHDPEILILDEPTTGLDPNQIVEIRKLIKELGKAKTVILSTHILPEVEATCDRILIINEGAIVADGTSADLRKKASGQEVINVKIEDGEADQVLAGLNKLPTVAYAKSLSTENSIYEVTSNVSEHSARAIFGLCVDRGWVLTEMTPIETKLEDVFRNVTMK